MSYAVWSALWHVIASGEELTLCGRPVPPYARRQETPPEAVFLCAACARREVRPLA